MLSHYLIQLFVFQVLYNTEHCVYVVWFQAREIQKVFTSNCKCTVASLVSSKFAEMLGKPSLFRGWDRRNISIFQSVTAISEC